MDNFKPLQIIKKTNTNKSIKLILYLITIIIFTVVVYFSYTSYVSYYKSASIFNITSTMLIKDWTSGLTVPVEPTVELPQSMVGNEYSLSFLVFLNDLKEDNRTKSQTILTSGTGATPDIEIKIEPLNENPHSDFRFIFKLQTPTKKTDLDSILLGNDEDVEDVETGDVEEDVEDGDVEEDVEADESFANLNNNNNHVTFNTVQSIYPQELFDLISKEKFQGGGGENDNTEDLTLFLDFIKTKMDSNQELTYEDIMKFMTQHNIKIDNDEFESGTITQLLESLGFSNAKISTAKNKNEIMNRDFKDTDFVELNNNTTNNVIHVAIVVYNNIVDIYSNGVLISSKTLEGLPSTNREQFKLFPNADFNGYINNLTYFNKALNYDEIYNNYKQYYSNTLEKIPFII